MATIETHFSPDEDLKAIFLAFVDSTEDSFYLADYGFHLPELTDRLIKMHEDNKGIGCVLDWTQEQGKYEHPQVVRLFVAKVDVAVGTSMKKHIMHDKFAIKDKRYVLAGSWNFSESATSESNFFFIIDDPELAVRFMANWQEMHDWILANEPQYQVTAGAS